MLKEFNLDVKAVVISLLQVGNAVTKIYLLFRQQPTHVEGLYKVGKLYGIPSDNAIEVLDLNELVLEIGSDNYNLVSITDLFSDEVMHALSFEYGDDFKGDGSESQNQQIL